MFRVCLLAVKVLLFFQGIQDAMTNSLFISHHGNDLDYCGNWTVPCRSIRQAVKISNDGDQIYIDYAQGKPYMECENITESACSIELTKSLSFHGMNGKPKVRCRSCSQFFRITSPSLKTTRVQFINLIIFGSNIVAELVEARSELEFHNTLIKENFSGIQSRSSIYCFIKISNSSFEHNFNEAIRLGCFNLVVDISFSTFKLNYIRLANIGNKSTRWQNMVILIRNTVFDYVNAQRCVEMLLVKPFAAIFNATITDSVFRNHVAICRSEHKVSTISISDHQSDLRNITFIFFSNLLIENNYNNYYVLSLIPCFYEYTEVKTVIQNSIFRNNSQALWLTTANFDKVAKLPTLLLENNTFVDNVNGLFKPLGAAAISFHDCKSRVSSCRFVDNRGGPNPYTGVVTISERALVTFVDCYFENQQTSAQSNQVFVLGNVPLYFRGFTTFNLVALKAGQSVFMRIPTALNAGVIINVHFKILCPRGYTLHLQGQCVVIKTGYLCYYIDVQCEQCPAKSYTLDRGELIFNESNDIQCLECPLGGDCDSGLITAKPNFWGYETKSSVSFIQCLPGYCCESEHCVTFNSCYGNRSGTLCGECPEGMSESLFSTQCISNTECSINYVIIIATITVMCLYLAFFFYHTETVNFLRTSIFSKRLLFFTNSQNTQRSSLNTGGSTHSSSGMIKIFFYYYQICHLLRSSVGSPGKGGFIHNVENVISSVMNMVLVFVPSFTCPLKDLRPVFKAVLLHSVGFCLLGLLCVLYLAGLLFLFLKRLKSGSERRSALQYVPLTRFGQGCSGTKLSFSQRVASAFTLITLLMYASSTQLCLSLLHCVQVGDSEVLLLDGTIKCYQTFQYILLAYMISSILPFCLVPVLGSYLLKFGRIGVKQFCAACIFPLPFCCVWVYMMLQDCRRGHQGTYDVMVQNNRAVSHEQSNNEIHSCCGEEATSTTNNYETTLHRGSETSILKVLLGPFRSHQAFMCFPSSLIPWEGFLIFRRLVLIIVLNFMYDIQIRLFLTLSLCVAILIFHMFVYPFQRKQDNVLESFSLGGHVILCGLTLIKTFYYDEDFSSISNTLLALNVIENILVVVPLSIIITAVILSFLIKIAFCFKHCLSFLIGKVRRIVRFTV